MLTSSLQRPCYPLASSHDVVNSTCHSLIKSTHVRVCVWERGRVETHVFASFLCHDRTAQKEEAACRVTTLSNCTFHSMYRNGQPFGSNCLHHVCGAQWAAHLMRGPAITVHVQQRLTRRTMHDTRLIVALQTGGFFSHTVRWHS